MRAIDKEVDFEYIDKKINQSVLNAKAAKLIKIRSPQKTYTTMAVQAVLLFVNIKNGLMMNLIVFWGLA